VSVRVAKGSARAGPMGAAVAKGDTEATGTAVKKGNGRGRPI